MLNTIIVGLFTGFVSYLFIHLYRKLQVCRFDKRIELYIEKSKTDILFIVDSDIQHNSNYIVPINDSSKFINFLRKNRETNKSINLIIQCNGGSITESDIIVNAILHHKNPIFSYIPNYAASAASLIALSSKEIYLNPYAYLTPNDPQIYIDKIGMVSSNVLANYLDKYNDNAEILLLAIDAKIYHKDNINIFKEIMKKHNLSENNECYLLDLFTSGNYPHHKPITYDTLINLGLPIKNSIPYKITELFNLYSLL